MRTPYLPIILLAAAACEGGGDIANPPTAREVLAQPTAMAVAPAETMAMLHAQLDRGSITEEGDVSVAVTEGVFTVQAAGDRVAVDDLTLKVADIELPFAIFPAKPVLTGVQIHLAAPMNMGATWMENDEAAYVDGEGELLLNWSIRVGGVTYPLSSQIMANLGFALQVTRDDDRVRVDLAAIAHGVMWSWADIAALGDLTLVVTAYTPAE